MCVCVYVVRAHTFPPFRFKIKLVLWLIIGGSPPSLTHLLTGFVFPLFVSLAVHKLAQTEPSTRVFNVPSAATLPLKFLVQNCDRVVVVVGTEERRGLKASRPVWFCRFSTRRNPSSFLRHVFFSLRERSRMFLICSRSFSLSSFATLSGSPLESQKWKKRILVATRHSSSIR